MVVPEFSTCMHQLVRPFLRRNGSLEMRGVEVEGSYRPHSHDNVSAWDSDQKFVDEYLARLLKRVSVGDQAFMVPAFKKFLVLGGDGLGLDVILEEVEGMAPPLLMNFGDVGVAQNFSHRDGSISKILLLPDHREVNT